MPDFNAPIFLFLLAIPAALLIAYIVAQARYSDYAVRFTNLDLLDEVAPDKPGWKRHVPAAALLLTLVVLVVGLARPTRDVEVPVEASTVVLALDVSISMDARDVEPRRFEAAKEAAYAFLDQVPDQVRVGLVSFAETAVAELSPTDDRAVVRQAVEDLRLRPGTAIGDALLQSVEMIQADLAALQAEAETVENPSTIVVLSDGDTTAGTPNGVGVQAAQDAEIAVSTISFGTRSGTILFQGQIVAVPANDRDLRRIADDTGGRFFDAESSEQLTEIFSELGVAVGFTTEEVEVLVPFLLGGLLLATLAAILSLLWFQRLP